ncbi:MAG TPA: hypothetical protein DCS82_11860 [Rhodospirillaceae bacterium]|nr:hypothetical protein [Rhodospirillaceae bacterium]HAT36406.1 hypothetical protein [Rhodospirillaceae bacterium]
MGKSVENIEHLNRPAGKAGGDAGCACTGGELPFLSQGILDRGHAEIRLGGLRGAAGTKILDAVGHEFRRVCKRREKRRDVFRRRHALAALCGAFHQALRARRNELPEFASLLAFSAAIKRPAIFLTFVSDVKQTLVTRPFGRAGGCAMIVERLAIAVETARTGPTLPPFACIEKMVFRAKQRTLFVGLLSRGTYVTVTDAFVVMMLA